MPKTTALATSAVILVLGLSACGGSSTTTRSISSTPAQAPSAPTSSTTTSEGQTITALPLAADPNGDLKFNKTSLTAKAGKVKIQFTNATPLGHNVTIQQGSSGPVIGATATFTGGTKTLTVNLKPGTYTFYCSVPGHRAAGMKGTLTVH
jgi:plastocyanin